RPRVGGRTQLLRATEDGIHYVGADRRKWHSFVKQGGQRVGSRSETSQCQRGATRARLVAAKIAGHVANPWHIVARASRGEHSGGETSAQRGGVEEDRRASAGKLTTMEDNHLGCLGRQASRLSILEEETSGDARLPR